MFRVELLDRVYDVKLGRGGNFIWNLINKGWNAKCEKTQSILPESCKCGRASQVKSSYFRESDGRGIHLSFYLLIYELNVMIK